MLYADTQNTLAGGAPPLPFLFLLLAGLNPLAANITSTIALLPNQITSSLAGCKLAGQDRRDESGYAVRSQCDGRHHRRGAASPYSRDLLRRDGSLARAIRHCHIYPMQLSQESAHAANFVPIPLLAAGQFLIGVYGGYFGGGIGFLMLAILSIAGQRVRMAIATKNVLAMDASAVALFVFSSQVDWLVALALGVGGAVEACRQLAGAPLAGKNHARFCRNGRYHADGMAIPALIVLRLPPIRRN